jgi:hypothetical protein
MGNNSGRRWSHKDGIPVLYTRAYPNGLTYAIIPAPPDCPIELRAELRRIREELKEARARARVLYHKKLVWERRLGEVIDGLSQKAVLGGSDAKTDALR